MKLKNCSFNKQPTMPAVQHVGLFINKKASYKLALKLRNN
jgi:hypothetical protein